MTPYDAAMAGVIVAGMVWGLAWDHLAIGQHLLPGARLSPLPPPFGQLAPHFPGEPVVARSLAMLTVYPPFRPEFS